MFMPAAIEIQNSKIARVMAQGSVRPDADYGGRMILPGFIDIHTHGAYGFDVDSGEADGLSLWAKRLPEEGVTSFLPSTTSQPTDVTVAALENIADVMAGNPVGAEILGAHLEGPMLDKKYRGAHPEACLRPPTIDLFTKMQLAAKGQIKYLTLAPEHDADFNLTRLATENGVVVSVGHSGADLGTAMLAVANGAKSFTHSFNAMSGVHHRSPGVAAALMRCYEFAEIVGDGLHVFPDIINILFKAHPRMILISDSLKIKGLSPGVYGERELRADGAAYAAGTDTMAGSAMFMNKGVKLLVREALVSIEAAILAATLHPALLLGIEARKGQIKAGNDAEIIVMDDDFNVIQTYCRGEEML